MVLCSDGDLLFWEPTLVKECAAVASVLFASNDMSVSGTRILGTDPTLGELPLEPGMAVRLIVSGDTPEETVILTGVDADVNLTVTRVATLNYPTVRTSVAPILQGAVRTEVVTFPQAAPASEWIWEAAGLTGLPQSAVLNPGVLRRAAVMATIAAIVRSMATFDRRVYGAPGSLTVFSVAKGFIDSAATYETAAGRALRNLRLEVDLNGDGQVDEVRTLDAPRLKRD